MEPSAEPEAADAALRPLERHVLVGLADELDATLQSALGLAAVARRRGALEELARDARTQLARSRTAAVITLVGATGAGKSTLLNALVGRAIAREGEDRPTTSAPVVYRPRDADLADLFLGLPGEPPRSVDYDEARDVPWSGQVLIDAPDTNSVATLHREIVGALAARSDVLVVVAHRQSIAELSSARFVDLFAGRRGMLFVLNRADELHPADREALLAQLRELARQRFQAPDAPVLAVSARAAQRDPADPAWRALVQALAELATGEVLGSVRRRNALGSVAALAAEVRAVEPSAARHLADFEEATRAGLDGWRDGVLAAVTERLAHRERDLAQMLWNDAAKAWDGPGGYALRAGGLATVGLGAGAALARSNPALAAGAAIGALVADRARGALRERGFQSTSGLLPGDGELARLQRERLSAARLAAEELFSPELLAREGAALVPNEHDLAGLAARTVEEAWDDLLAVHLPAAAQRGLPRWVPWSVDLPVYALGAWVVAEAALGLVRGTYVGVDLLATAAIVAGAWLFLCRALVRRALASGGRGLLAAVRARIAGRLTEAVSAAREGALGAAEERRAALAALVAADAHWRRRLRAGGTGDAPRG